MANRLTTDIIVNLAGNMADKSRQYGQSMSGFASKSKAALSSLQTTLSAASRGIDTWGNRVVAAGGVAAFAFERTFVKTAAEFERYQIMLNQLQGGPQGGAKAMDWIKQFTQDTPFAVAEVTNSFVKLKAFGLDPMNGTMQAIADQTAQMGGNAETFDGIALALGQAWTKGKLQGEEALQLLERGVPVWDYLAKASKELGKNNGLGYTNEQLQKMASNGQLTRKAISDLINQMGKSTQGAARKQMESWSGMMSNIGDTWTLFQEDIMQSGAFDVLKDEVSGLLNQLNEMKKTGEYNQMVEQIGGNLVDAFRSAAEAIKSAKEMGDDLIPVIRTVADYAGKVVDMAGGFERVAGAMAAIYAANKLAPVVKGAYGLGKGAYDLLSGSRGGKGGVLGGAAASLGATPVYVVNMPAGGLGGGLEDLAGGKGGAAGPAGKASKLVSGLAAAGTVAYGATLVPEFSPVNVSRASARNAEAKAAGPGMLGIDTTGISAAPGLMDVVDEIKTLWTSAPASPIKQDAAAIVKLGTPAYLQPSGLNKPNSPMFDQQPMMDFSNQSSGLSGVFDEIKSWFSGAGAQPQQSTVALDVKVSDDRVTVKTRAAAPGVQVRTDTGPSLMP